MDTLEQRLRSTRRRLARGQALPPEAVHPCRLVLTAKKGTNGKVLNVRCECMAGTQAPPGRHHYAYDPVGEAPDLPAAVALWTAHRDSRSAGHG
jgi:hypothetical protein